MSRVDIDAIDRHCKRLYIINNMKLNVNEEIAGMIQTLADFLMRLGRDGTDIVHNLQ